METDLELEPNAWLLFRAEDWARLFIVSGYGAWKGRAELCDYCEGAYQSQEPLGDVWYLDAIMNEPVKITASGSATPYDEDDYAQHTIRFHRDDDTLSMEPISVSFRIDGRS